MGRLRGHFLLVVLVILLATDNCGTSLLKDVVTALSKHSRLHPGKKDSQREKSDSSSSFGGATSSGGAASSGNFAAIMGIVTGVIGMGKCMRDLPLLGQM